MRITSKGQVTIPAHIRDELGLLPDTEVDFEIDGSSARIVRAKGRKRRSRGERVVERLRGSGTVRMSTEQIMALTRRT